MAPDAALRAIAAFGGLVLVDLDETLYLSNSTEDFIDVVRPFCCVCSTGYSRGA